MAITGAAQEAMMWGGATSAGGAATGVYRVVVTEAALGMSKGAQDADGNYTKAPRPFVELEFFGKGDPDHPGKEGKKVTKSKFYGPSAADDAEKKKLMAGMLKRSLGDGFGIKWGTDGKPLDPRIFVKKEVFIAIGPGKANDDTGESRQEVLAIAPSRDKLPKKFITATNGAEEGEAQVAATATKKAGKTARA